MPRFEYKLVAAPVKSAKQKGLKGADAFAATLQDMMNDLAAQGWQYLRTETLPEDVRSGLTSKTTVYRNILVFQRALPDATSQESAQGTARTTTQTTAETPAPRLSLRAQRLTDRPTQQTRARDATIDPQGGGGDTTPALANLFVDPDPDPDPDPAPVSRADQDPNTPPRG